jgi:transcriptional regulator with XRE-family HTH domain
MDFIMCYDMTFVKRQCYIEPMPRVPKQILPPLNLSQDSIGQRIAKIRKAKGLTQQDLADKIGITRSVIANYERDRLRVYDEMLARIALALSVSTDQILGLVQRSDAQEGIHSLRFSRRIKLIEKLPMSEQKALIKTIDAYLKSAESTE